LHTIPFSSKPEEIAVLLVKTTRPTNLLSKSFKGSSTQPAQGLVFVAANTPTRVPNDVEEEIGFKMMENAGELKVLDRIDDEEENTQLEATKQQAEENIEREEKIDYLLEEYPQYQSMITEARITGSSLDELEAEIEKLENAPKDEDEPEEPAEEETTEAGEEDK